MSMRRFNCQPVEAEFFDTAPFRISETFKANKPASDVWAELVADDALHWCRLLRDVTWTSERPFGVGTTRKVRTVANASVLNEQFFRWEDGRRKSFYVVDSNAPLFNSFAEDYLVEPTSDTSCEFTWTIAADPKSLVRPANPLNKLLLTTLFSDTRKHFQ